MARFLVSFGLFSIVTNIGLALMVTPGSPCMSLCSNGQGSDSIDGSEIVCQNNHFITTTAGQKLKSCLSCLQLSTAAGNDQNDQHRFIYNIRYTLASCLYGFSNVTDTIATPCSTSKACGQLQIAIEDGNLITSNETAYGYCSVNYNSILSSGTSACVSCLEAGNIQSYLSNSLQAGCHQQPPDGTIIGLNDSVFSQHIITETSPGKSYNTTISSSSTSKKGISKNAIIGISIGLCILLLITIFIIYILWRKSITLKRRRNDHSSLDERYGALNITAPNEGAFGNPTGRYKTITLAAPPPARKRKNTNTTPLFNLSKYHSDDESFHKRDTNIFPTHQAYYPPSHPHSKAEDMLPILPNDEFSSPYPYPFPHPPSSNEHSPIPNPARSFSAPAYNLARRLDRKEGATFYNRGNAQNKRMERNLDRDMDVNRDITTTYARAAIDGTQSSGISVSSLSYNTPRDEMRLDSSEVDRTQSPSMGGENRGMSEKERDTNTNREREKKKKRVAKRVPVINDQDQDQDQDQWPGEF